MFKCPTRGEIREVVGRKERKEKKKKKKRYKKKNEEEKKEKKKKEEEKKNMKRMATQMEKDRERLEGGTKDIIQQKLKTKLVSGNAPSDYM